MLLLKFCLQNVVSEFFLCLWILLVIDLDLPFGGNFWLPSLNIDTSSTNLIDQVLVLIRDRFNLSLKIAWIKSLPFGCPNVIHVVEELPAIYCGVWIQHHRWQIAKGMWFGKKPLEFENANILVDLSAVVCLDLLFFELIFAWKLPFSLWHLGICA